jgi:hypothetical protein
MTTREDQQGGESADPSMPPPEVIEAFAKHCRCCGECQSPPCDGVIAGGFCDEMCWCGRQDETDAENDEGDGFVCHECGAVYPTCSGQYDAARDMWLCGPNCPGEPACEPTP